MDVERKSVIALEAGLPRKSEIQEEESISTAAHSPEVLEEAKQHAALDSGKLWLVAGVVFALVSLVGLGVGLGVGARPSGHDKHDQDHYELGNSGVHVKDGVAPPSGANLPCSDVLNYACPVGKTNMKACTACVARQKDMISWNSSPSCLEGEMTKWCGHPGANLPCSEVLNHACPVGKTNMKACTACVARQKDMIIWNSSPSCSAGEMTKWCGAPGAISEACKSDVEGFKTVCSAKGQEGCKHCLLNVQSKSCAKDRKNGTFTPWVTARAAEWCKPERKKTISEA